MSQLRDMVKPVVQGQDVHYSNVATERCACGGEISERQVHTCDRDFNTSVECGYCLTHLDLDFDEEEECLFVITRRVYVKMCDKCN